MFAGSAPMKVRCRRLTASLTAHLPSSASTETYSRSLFVMCGPGKEKRVVVCFSSPNPVPLTAQMESPSKSRDNASSKLYRDISPPRGPVGPTQTSLPDLFKKPGALQTLRPGISTTYNDEYDSEDAGQKPRMLLMR